MWDLLWKKGHLGRFPLNTLVSPANSHSTDCPILIMSSGTGIQTNKQTNKQTNSVALSLQANYAD
jgi:hypothetical protein